MVVVLLLWLPVSGGDCRGPPSLVSPLFTVRLNQKFMSMNFLKGKKVNKYLSVEKATVPICLFIHTFRQEEAIYTFFDQCKEFIEQQWKHIVSDMAQFQ